MTIDVLCRDDAYIDNRVMCSINEWYVSLSFITKHTVSNHTHKTTSIVWSSSRVFSLFGCILAPTSPAMLCRSGCISVLKIRVAVCINAHRKMIFLYHFRRCFYVCSLNQYIDTSPRPWNMIVKLDVNRIYGDCFVRPMRNGTASSGSTLPSIYLV